MKNRVSLEEFSISMLMLIVLIVLSLAISIPQELILISISIGVAYGIETAVVLWFSGVFYQSTKNKLGRLESPIKVVGLVLITYLILNNDTAIQQLTTRITYSIFIITFGIGVVLTLNGFHKKEEIDWWEAGFVGLFLSGPLLVIFTLVAVLAALAPSTYVLVSIVIGIVMILVYWIRMYQESIKQFARQIAN